MMRNNLTVKKVMAKLAQNQRLTHSEELFYLVEVLYFSEEKAEQMLACQGQESKGRDITMHEGKFATAA